MDYLAKKIRAKCVKIAKLPTGCHLGGCLSVTDILLVLFKKFYLHDKNNAIILSKGHAAAALYSTLFVLNLIQEDPELNYGQNTANFTGHPNHKIQHVLFATGSLGHGPALGLGWALGQKLNNLKGKAYVIVGDGELQEGSCWETFMVAAALKLDNFCIVVDRNKAQNDGWVEEICSLGKLTEKAQAFGFAVIEVDGHDFIALEQAAKTFVYDKPIFIIANTIKGKGIKELENNVKSHYVTAKPGIMEKWVKEILA